jgi:hypothetical protein
MQNFLDETLCDAAMNGDLNRMRRLIALGANPRGSSDGQFIPLLFAMSFENRFEEKLYECARLLLDYGAPLVSFCETIDPLLDFVARRERVRCAAVAFMGATTKGRRIFLDRNVLQLIGRWVWATRGLK